MGDALGDLIEALLVVGRDGEDVADIAERDLLPQIDTHLVVVGGVERRDPADALGSEAGAGSVGGAGIVGHTHDRHVVLAHPVHILQVGGLHEGVDAREVGQFTAREGGDVAVNDALGRFKPQALGLIHFLLPAGERQTAFLLEGAHPLTGMQTFEGAGGA